jgi:predicted aldo/keto reductase-like oxidoreductase
MLYRKMKKNGDELSILGFGCMRLPQKKGSPGSGKIYETRATRQIHYAIEQGVNYFDTAMPYHLEAGEPFLGRALSDGYRDKIKLTTKLPPGSVKALQDMDQLTQSSARNIPRSQWCWLA